MVRGVSTCASCGNKFPTKDMKIYSSQKYCNNCYEEKKQEKEHWNNLYDYIRDELLLDRKEQIPIKVITLLHRYKKEYNLTYFGMLECLKYMKNIINIEFNDEDKLGIGLIPYYYDDTKKYCYQLMNLESLVNDFIIKDTNKIVKGILPSNKKRDRLKILKFDEEVEKGDE